MGAVSLASLILQRGHLWLAIFGSCFRLAEERGYAVRYWGGFLDWGAVFIWI